MRLFVALDIPDAVRRALRELMARLKPECSDARWVRPEGIHITLKFLGETDGAKLDSITSVLSALHPVGQVELDFRGIGFFPNEFHPRVIWCGVEASPNLTALAASVDRALQPLDFPAETRAFTPHLTLARFDSHKGLDTLVRAANNLKSYDFGSARQSEFYLYQSVLKREGSQYTRLATFPFAEKA
ncbi:MAG: RNA 2',3'-cyclic phosphodiesterase [Candidatus Acidiferrales bacterium]